MSFPVFKKIQDLFQKRQLKKSIEDLVRALETNPDDTRIRLRLADLYHKAGLKEEALEHYRRSAERLAAAGFQSRAIAIYKQIHRLDPQAAEVLGTLARLSREQGLLGDSLHYYTEFARSPGTAAGTKEIVSGLAGIEVKDLELKLTLIEEVLAGDTKARDPYERICTRLKEFCDQLDSVEDVCTIAQYLCSTFPERWQAYEVLAYILHRQGDRKRLDDILGRLEQMYRHAGVYSEKVRVIDSLRGRPTTTQIPEPEQILTRTPVREAETLVDQIKIKIETNIYDILKRKAEEDGLPEEGGAPERTAQDVGFEELFQNFKNDLDKKIGKQDYETHFNLGVAYREMSLHEDAIREFEIAMTDPKLRYDCYFLIGQSFMELDRPEAAIDIYQKGLSMEGLTTEKLLGLSYELGLAFLKAGRTQDALQEFTRVSRLQNDYRDVAEHIRALEEGLDVVKGDKASHP